MNNLHLDFDELLEIEFSINYVMQRISLENSKTFIKYKNIDDKLKEFIRKTDSYDYNLEEILP